jgi:hypothetical protein
MGKSDRKKILILFFALVVAGDSVAMGEGADCLAGTVELRTGPTGVIRRPGTRKH